MKMLILVRRLNFLFGLVLLAGMLAGAATAQADATFSAPIGTSLTTGIPPSWAAAGDFNEDGILDAVIVSETGKLHLMMGNDDGLGNGDGSFNEVILSVAGFQPGNVRVGRLNNDAHLDIVFAANPNNVGSLVVLMGNGDGTFGAPTSYPVFFGGTRAVAIGDLDGVNGPDLIGGNWCGASAVLLNNGDGTFGSPTTLSGCLPGNAARSVIKTADLNGDGNLDVVIGNQSSNISVYLGDGAGGLSLSDFLDNGDSSANGVAVGDFNSDGIPDIAANSLWTGFHVFLGNEDTANPGKGDGTFGPFTAYAARNVPPGVASWTLIVQAADFDLDGNLDLAASNQIDSHNISLVHGDGAGSFGPFSTHPNPIDTSVLVNPVGLVAGDFNGDGKPDILASSASNPKKAVVFLNTTITAPSEIPFAAFGIRKARVKLDKKADKDKFDVKGRFTLGDDSDGSDPLNEDVTVTFGDFTETIPAGSFVLKGKDDKVKFEFKGPKGGIIKVKIRGDGRFDVKARGLDLGALDIANPVPFSLQVGDDVGETEISFEVDKKGQKGKFKAKKGKKKHDDDDDDEEDDEDD
ncbi:FG-GAP repeat domain-containing protein [Nitrospinota bacterium]